MEEITLEIIHSDLQSIISALTNICVYVFGIFAWSILKHFHAKKRRSINGNNN